MAAIQGWMRSVLSLHRSVTLRCSLGLVPVQLISTCAPRRLCHTSKEHNKLKQPVSPENESLLENLNLLGVDVNMVRRRQPGVLRKSFTNEQAVVEFLQSKGASRSVIAGIITRYPRAITRSLEHVDQRWRLWRNIFMTDKEIVSIIDRSPESFFRSSDNVNLEKNITFLLSLGLKTKDLHRLLTTAPRTFSNSFELNRQMVEFLEDTCVGLGGENPEIFSRRVISKNLYLLIRSTNRIRKNIELLRAFCQMSDSELLAFLQGSGAVILDLSNEYLKMNLSSLLQKLLSLGCKKTDFEKLVISYPMVLYTGKMTLGCKLDYLLKQGITLKQILDKPRVLDYSTQNITEKVTDLQRMGYDFQKHGINILDSSHKRFVAKLERLSAASNLEST